MMCKRVKSTPFKSTLRKCGKKDHDQKDQISNLPDEILIYILSFLTLKEAAVTAFLARRWIHLWKYGDHLDFDAQKTLLLIFHNACLVRSSRAKFVEWVNQVVDVHLAFSLKEFKVYFDLHKSNKPDVDKWLEFAFQKGVQRLELNFLKRGFSIDDCGYIFKNYYSFPAKLTQLNHNGMQSNMEFNFKPLKELKLKCVNISEDVLKFILSNCPLLERLEVYGSGTLVNVEVSGPELKLKYLEICYCDNLKSAKICNINLVSFKFVGEVGSLLPLEDVPFLVEASIGWLKSPADVFAKLSSCLANLQTLNIYAREYEYWGNYELPELLQLKHLSFMVKITQDSDNMRFGSWLEACPHLETLKILLEWSALSRRTIEAKNPPWHPHHHLKLVEFRGYGGRKSDIGFVMYLWRNAVALQELVIDPCGVDLLGTPLPVDNPRSWVEEAKKYAKQQLEGNVPPGVKLTIL